MIINLRFGYAARHHIYYDIDRKRGTIKLWSPHGGPVTGADSIENHDALPSRLVLRPGTLAGMFFRENQQNEFSIADEQDILSMLAALAAVQNGGDSSFMSKEGRRIAFSLRKECKSEKDVIAVKIQYGRAAMLTMGEAHKLHTIAMNLLRDLGYSEQQISDKLEHLAHGLSN